MTERDPQTTTCSTCGGTGVILDPEDAASPEYECPDCGFDEDGEDE